MAASKSPPPLTPASPSSPEDADGRPTTFDSTLVNASKAEPSLSDDSTLNSEGQRPRPDSVTSQQPVEQRIGRFQVERLLGRGGQGKVWLALDPVLGRRVAIKELPKGTELSEARLAAAIEHPNVCRVYDFLSTDEHDYIVMEYVDGETLFRAVNRGLSRDEGLRALWQVARGLAAAHERGVVHRDLKSENVLFTAFGVSKITDFGISKRDDEPASNDRVLTGTPHSMSPEQTLGQATDARSDLFSFGVLCHEVIVGKSPFLGRDLQETLHRVRALTPPPLHDLDPNVPRSFSLLVERLLSKSPADRENSAARVARALETIVDQSQRTNATPSSGRGERRQIVLVACELTLAPGREDPELLLQFRQAYRRAVEHAVDEQGGSVHVAIGQQYVLCFGYPEPHEDSGARAARAALRIKSWPSSVSAEADLTARVAIHSGTAVILEQARGPELELGNLLGTVQGLREQGPDTAVNVSDAACEVLRQSVKLGELATLTLGGRAQAYRSLQRVEDHRGRDGLRLVGREEELSLLVRSCRRAEKGAGKLVLIQGEPGIGKSRLLRAVRDELGERQRWAIVRATPDTSHTPFAPIAELLADLLGMAGAPGEERWARAQGKLESYGIPAEDVLPYFDSLLRLPATPGTLAPAWESPERRREATLGKIVTLLQRYAEKESLVLVLEDAHWADASTLELLERLAPRLGGMKVALLITARTEFSHEGLSGPNVSVLQLGALSAEESAQLIQHAAGAEGLSASLVASIVARADGVPLFLEHVVQALRNRASEATPSSSEIPSSLRDLFAAQLHRVGVDRAALEVGAVIGREFELSLLCRTARISVEQGSQLLSRLANQGLLEIAPSSGEDEVWQFRHALIRDAAYDSMLKQRRQSLHAEVLDALGAASPRAETERPELLARHAEAAGALERAIELWLRAATRWVSRYALREADHAYEQCLRLLGTLAASGQRDERELEILAARGAIQQALFGYAADPVAKTYQRADELCRSLEEVPFPVIRGVWNVHVVRGDKPATLKYAERIEALLSAERLGRLDRSMAHNCLGTFHWFTGELRRCLHHYEAAAYDAKDHGSMVATYGGCGGAYCRILSPYARAVLGSLGAAQRDSQQILRTMSELTDPFSHAMALLYDVMLDRELGAYDRAFATADVLLARCQEHGFAQLLPLAAITVAAGRVRRDQDLASLKIIGDSLTALGAVGARTPAAYWLAWLAEALLSVGAAKDALAAVDHGIGASQSGLDHFYDAELRRLRAQALKALGQPEADVCAELEQALAIAREREHALFELKAASDLAEIVGKRGERERAHRLLREALAKLEDAAGAPVVERATKLLDWL
jgi:serine/threonine protein kinase/tetratricopeptide (TPR) repeat protein